MKASRLFLLGSLCATFCLIALAASANILLDEDFEGSAVFVDRNWAIKDSSVTPITQAVIDVKGINLHSYSDAAAYTVPKVSIGTNQGAVVTERRFLGTKSYKLTSGQALAVTPNGFPNRCNNYERMWQFAVSTDGGSAAKPAGTTIGHFKVDFGTEGTADTTVDVTVRVNLVTNASGKVDIIAQNTGVKIGELTGEAGNWALLTIVGISQLTDARVDSAVAWKNLDPISGLRKGPAPVVNPPDQATATDYYQMPAGVSFFVNSNTPATVLTRGNSLGAAWGTSANPTVSSPAEIQWEFAAENGGTIYIDNFTWTATGVHNGEKTDGTWLHVGEAMARMQVYNKATTEPKEIIAGATNWTLY